MTQNGSMKKLGKTEFYKCPLTHARPRHNQAFFKDFDAHFRIFGDRDDHLAVAHLHEELVWNMRRVEAEKTKLSSESLHRISFEAWLEAIRRHTGKPIQIVEK
jgi:hypothetical protein